MDKVKILIAEDHTLVAKLIYQMLATEVKFEILGIISNGSMVFDEVKVKKPDVILMDIDMPGQDGIKTTAQVKKSFQNVKILMLSNHIEANVIQKALKSGASGYLSKFSDAEDVIEGIKTVIRGETFYCKTSMKAMMDHYTHADSNNKIQSAYLELTHREKEILRMVAKEHSSKDISNILILSIRTVETHRRNIMKKLGVKSIGGLIKLAIEHDLNED